MIDFLQRRHRAGFFSAVGVLVAAGLIASAADPHAHSIFLVDDAPRISIARERTGVSWGDEYHTVRIVRDTERETIEVFFDDMTTPIMRTEDRTFTWGRVGFGSFDDSGLIDDVRVWGNRLTPPRSARSGTGA